MNKFVVCLICFLLSSGQAYGENMAGQGNGYDQQHGYQQQGGYRSSYGSGHQVCGMWAVVVTLH